MDDATRLGMFVKWADAGYCPALVFDDDGRWAVVFDGDQSLPMEDGARDVHMSFMVYKGDWHASPQEAIDEAFRQFPVD
jgi:hypothetical protein